MAFDGERALLITQVQASEILRKCFDISVMETGRGQKIWADAAFGQRIFERNYRTNKESSHD
jgi:hypothetical protein